MSTIITRTSKGSPLTNAEMDANLNNLNTDKLETSVATASYQPLDGDLTAIAAIATTGYAKRTGASTWVVSSTVPGSDITGAIDNVTVGLTVPAAARVTTLKIGTSSFLGTEVFRVVGDTTISGVVGMFGPITPNTIISIGPGTHPLASTNLQGVFADITIPAVGSAVYYNFISTIRTTAGGYNASALTHFYANATSLGAGSTVSVVYAFAVSGGVAVGTTNYGYYANIIAAAGNYQLYMDGTAANYIRSDLRIGTTALIGTEKLRVNGAINTETLVVNQLATIAPVTSSTMDNVVIGSVTPKTGAFTSLGLGGFSAPTNSTVSIGLPTGTGVNLSVAKVVAAAPSTTTSGIVGFESQVSSAAAAFTLPSLSHFNASSTTQGAGSTISVVYGFVANNAIASGTTNVGFANYINASANNYGLFFNGTAYNWLNGELGVKTTPNTAYSLNIGTPTTAGPAVYGVNVNVNGTSSAAVGIYGLHVALSTTAASYTISEAHHFKANGITKGAGSIITNSYGFYASSQIAYGVNTYAFYSGVSAGANQFQFYAAGTAESYFGGSITMLNGTVIGWGIPGAPDLQLGRASAGVLQLINGTTAQSIRIYGTTTGTKYLTVAHDGSNAIIDTSATAGRISFGGNASSIFALSHLLFTDNTFDIGATGANRPRSGFFAASVYSPIYASTTTAMAFNTSTTLTQFQIYETAAAARYVRVTGSAAGNPMITTSAGALSVGVSLVHLLGFPAYSASVTINAFLGNTFIISANNGTAFTINAPTNPSSGQVITVIIRNTSGGALGVATWDAVFKMAAGWTQPGNGFSRSITLVYNGTNWVEIIRSAADVAN